VVKSLIIRSQVAYNAVIKQELQLFFPFLRKLLLFKENFRNFGICKFFLT